MKYEYSTVAFDTTAFWVGATLDHEAFNQKLNDYGQQGWDLVNVFEMNRRQGATFEVVAVFKREQKL